MTTTGEFITTGTNSEGFDAISVVSDGDAYAGDWQLDNTGQYVQTYSGGGGGGTVAAGGFSETTATKGAPLTLIRKFPNGDVTVRANVSIGFSIDIPFNGTVSGVAAAGSTFTGRDSNHNDIPDLLEKGLKNKSVNFEKL